MEGRLTLRADLWPNENLQSLMWVLKNIYYVNDILIPLLMCYHTFYVGTIIDSFNTAL
jgi:hypothetical protein